MKPIPYGRQSIGEDDIAAVVEVLRSDFLTQGPQVEKFESEFAKFLGETHAVAVANGTAALHLAALALGVKPGDRVLVSTNTFVSSANCIRFCGADVEFVDSDESTLCLDLNLLEKMLKAKPKGHYAGIVAVDFAGYPVDFERLRQLADTYHLWIIEDSCHALGAEFQNSVGQTVKSGSGAYADIAVFSFHPVKHIATGEGGMVVTRNPELLRKVRSLRTHGITRDPKLMGHNHGPWYYEMQTLGFNYRMPDILCALGSSQLRKIDKNLSARQKIAEVYNQELRPLPLRLPQVPTTSKHAHHLYVVLCDQRDRLYAFLKEREIHCQVHYIPVHTQPYYRDLYGTQKLPVAEGVYARALSLPMYHALTLSDQERVISTLREFFR